MAVSIRFHMQCSNGLWRGSFSRNGEVIDVLGKAVKGGYSLSLLSDKGLLRTYIRTTKGYIDDNGVIDAINDEFLTQL